MQYEPSSWRGQRRQAEACRTRLDLALAAALHAPTLDDRLFAVAAAERCAADLENALAALHIALERLSAERFDRWSRALSLDRARAAGQDAATTKTGARPC
jgi:hypothetical protein